MARRPSSQKKPKTSKPAKAQGKAMRRNGAKKAASDAGKKGQWVYTFGGGKAQGRSGMKDLLGGKGACLLYTSPSPRDRTRSRMPSSA